MKIIPVNDADGKQYGRRFYCPGCDDYHDVGLGWKYNNNPEIPTLSPSVLVTGKHYDHKTDKWSDVRCHSFVRDGKIQYLNDCHHDLKGQTVEMRDIIVEEID